MTKIFTPAELHSLHHYRVSQQPDPRELQFEKLRERCAAAILSSVPSPDLVVDVHLSDEPEDVVADVISHLRTYNWVAREVDNGKGEGFNKLAISPAPLTMPGA